MAYKAPQDLAPAFLFNVFPCSPPHTFCFSHTEVNRGRGAFAFVSFVYSVSNNRGYSAKGKGKSHLSSGLMSWH